MDFMPTVVDVAGATYPRIYKGHTITPSTGISLMASFQGVTSVGHKTLFNEHFGARYVRSDDWKLVSTLRDSSWHLFNLATDRTETQDLAAQHPDEVRRLDKLWQQWANSHQVFPKPKR